MKNVVLSAEGEEEEGEGEIARPFKTKVNIIEIKLLVYQLGFQWLGRCNHAFASFNYGHVF